MDELKRLWRVDDPVGIRIYVHYRLLSQDSLIQVGVQTGHPRFVERGEFRNDLPNLARMDNAWQR